MNIDQDYKRRVRITSEDVTPYTVQVQDVETGEAIDNVFRAEIWLDPRELNVARLSYYETNESGRIVVGDDDKPIERTVVVRDPEIDVTAYERS